MRTQEYKTTNEERKYYSLGLLGLIIIYLIIFFGLLSCAPKYSMPILENDVSVDTIGWRMVKDSCLFTWWRMEPDNRECPVNSVKICEFDGYENKYNKPEKCGCYVMRPVAILSTDRKGRK